MGSAHGFVFTQLQSGTGSANVGLFRVNTGTIKNLTIGKSDYIAYESTYSVLYQVNYVEFGEKYESSVYVGGFVGSNTGSGKIEGCKLINVKISATLADENNNASLFLGVAGIAGSNSATISYCETLKSTLKLNCTETGNSGDNGYGYLGGIVASNEGGTVNECISEYNTLDLDIRGNGRDLGNKSYLYGYLGNIAGIQTNGYITLCSEKGNTIKHYMTQTAYTKSEYYEGNIVGKNENGVVE